MFAGKSTELLRRVAAHEVRECFFKGGGGARRGGCPLSDLRSPSPSPSLPFPSLPFPSLLQAAGRTVLVFASAKDTRYAPGGGAVVTHTGLSRPTTAAGPTLAAAAAAAGGPAALAAADVLAIDEAQFFPDLLPFATGAADLGGKTVIVAGLDGDFRRRPFGGVGGLLPHADTITKLASACAVCGGAAHFSVRLTTADGSGGDAPTPPGSPLKRQSLEGPQVVVGGAERYAAVCRTHYNEATAAATAAAGAVAEVEGGCSVWVAAAAAGPAPTVV